MEHTLSLGLAERTATLPIEVLWMVISTLEPDDEREVLPPWHITTRTLLSLCLTSRALYHGASALLYRHCVFLDNRWKASRFSRLLHDLQSSTHASPAIRNSVSQIKKMFCAPFSGSHPLDISPDSGYIEEPPFEKRSIDSFNELTYLDERTIAEMAIILQTVAPSLRILLVDIAFHSAKPPWSYQEGCLANIRKAFESLVNLEECTSAYDPVYLYTPLPRPFIWTTWPNLRKLCLYDEDLDHWFQGTFRWYSIASLGSLEKLVLFFKKGACASLGQCYELTTRFLRAKGELAEQTGSEAMQPPNGVTLEFAHLRGTRDGYQSLTYRWNSMYPDDMTCLVYEGTYDRDGQADQLYLGYSKRLITELGLQGKLFKGEGKGAAIQVARPN